MRRDAQRRHQPCDASRCRVECIHGAEPEPAPVQQAAYDHLLHRVLHNRPVEAEPNGGGDLIGGRSVWLLRRDCRQDLRCRGRRAGRRRGVRVLCQGTSSLSPLTRNAACLCRYDASHR